MPVCPDPAAVSRCAAGGCTDGVFAAGQLVYVDLADGAGFGPVDVAAARDGDVIVRTQTGARRKLPARTLARLAAG